jgi:RNA polymerase sigma-70 factor, ECF subfamily
VYRLCVTFLHRPALIKMMTELRPATEGCLEAAIPAAQGGDEAAFRTVYRELQPRLARYLRVLVGDDADDVASETWLQIARDLPTFAGGCDDFRGWAATIARHRAMDHLRSLRRRPSVAVPADLLTDLADDQDTAAQAVEAISTEAAIALIATLPADQAEAVLLRSVVGLDAQAAGKVLGKRPGAVRTAAYRGLRRLSHQLTPDSTPAPRPRPFRPGVTPLQLPALKEVR